MFTESYLKDSLAKAEKDNVYKFYICINLEHSLFKNPESENYLIYPIDPYKYSIECLKYLNSRGDIKLIFTSNYDNYVKSKMLSYLKRIGIDNYYLEDNKDIYNIGWFNYSKNNFYYNILLDKRSGFDPDNDWLKLFNFFKINKFSEKTNMIHLYDEIDKMANFESEILDIKGKILKNYLEYKEKSNFILNYPFKFKENIQQKKKTNIFTKIFKR